MTDIATLSLRVDALEVKLADRELQRLNKTGGEVEATFKKLTVTAAKVFSVWTAANAIKDATMLSARYETLGISMVQAGQNAGYSSKQMDQFQAALEKTGISMLQARNTLIQMSAASMDLANATRLARAAQDLAVVGNTNSSEAFNRLVYGIKSGQTEILRTLGLNVQFEQGYKELAATLHKTTDALSEEEKMMARTNLVMDASTKYAGIYEAAMGTAAKQMSSLERYHENLKVIMGSTFTETLAAAVAAYTVEIKNLNKEAADLKMKGDLKEWGRATALVLATVADAARMVFNTVGAMATMAARVTTTAAILANPLGSGVPRLRALQDELKKDQAEFQAGMVDNLKIYESVAASFAASDAEDAARKQKKLNDDALFAKQSLMIMEAYKNDNAKMKEALAQLGDVWGGDYAAQYGTRPAAKSQPDANAAKKKAAEIKSLNDDIMRSALEAQRIIADTDPVYKATLEWERLLEFVSSGTMTMEQAAKAYAELAKDMDKTAKAAADSAEKEAKRAQNSWERFTDNVQRNLGDVMYDGLTGNFKSIGDSFKQMTLRMIADAAAAQAQIALFGSSPGGGLLGGLGSKIGKFFTPSFAGGGFTGGGARSGGIDGMGGFPAILHPNETVIDHAQERGAQQPSVTVVQNINIDSRSDAGTIVAAMMRAKDMAKVEIMNSLQRGGDFSRAVGRA